MPSNLQCCIDDAERLSKDLALGQLMRLLPSFDGDFLIELLVRLKRAARDHRQSDPPLHYHAPPDVPAGGTRS